MSRRVAALRIISPRTLPIRARGMSMDIRMLLPLLLLLLPSASSPFIVIPLSPSLLLLGREHIVVCVVLIR